MKKILMATAAIAALGVAAPALANGNNTGTDTQRFRVTGTNDAKCNIIATNNQVTLDPNTISDNQGFVRNSLDNQIAQKLTQLNVTAWCTGNSNALVFTRSSLATGNGDQTNNGFNRAVIYDLNVNIPGSHRANGDPVKEGTSDGPGNGPGIGAGAGLGITRFGATGDGVPVNFSVEPGSHVAAVSDGHKGQELARSAYTGESNGNRLVAGQYAGTLTLELTPGV